MVTKDLFALHFALPERAPSSSQERSQSSSSFSPHSLELVKSDAPNGATRARVGIPSHVVSIGGGVQNADRHLARVLYKFVKFHQEGSACLPTRAALLSSHSD